MTKEKTCKELVHDAFNSRMQDIRTLWNAPDHQTEELGRLADYALSLDHVPAHTFKEQAEGYRRYQISWGGPSEEFRLYTYGKMEFWYMDWFDGACVAVSGKDKEIIKAIMQGNI